MKSKKIVVLLGLFILVFTVEYFASLFTSATVKSWYPTLIKPSWTPPSWLFAPIWTLLYATMAVSIFLVWRAGGSIPVYIFWGLQLFFNFIWSFLFFTLKNPLLGLIDLTLLWITLVITIILSAKFSTWAAILLIPYLLWSSYAFALNAAIWWLNR